MQHNTRVVLTHDDIWFFVIVFTSCTAVVRKGVYPVLLYIPEAWGMYIMLCSCNGGKNMYTAATFLNVSLYIPYAHLVTFFLNNFAIAVLLD